MDRVIEKSYGDMFSQHLIPVQNYRERDRYKSRLCYHDGLLLRQEISDMLSEVQGNIAESEYRLKLVCGYRNDGAESSDLLPYIDKDGVHKVDYTKRLNRSCGHLSGAAVDVTLTYCDVKVDMDIREHSDLRVCLCEEMERVGFVRYPNTWWHFSYGDQYWAFRNYKDEALYGVINESDYYHLCKLKFRADGCNFFEDLLHPGKELCQIME